MTIQLSVGVRNAMLDGIEVAIGASAVVKLRVGAQPVDTSAADTGVVVATFNLLADYMSAAAAGAKSFSSLPLEDVSADNLGVLGHYRVYALDGVTCHMQGSITVTGGGGDMTVDNPIVAAGQNIKITSWTINMAGHA